MNRRIFLFVCLLALALASSAAWAQGAAKPGAPIAEKPADNNAAPQPAKKDAAAAKDSAVAAKDTAAAAKKNAAAKDSASAPKGLDLDKLLTADEEDDLLVGDKPKPAASAKAAVADSPSASADAPDGQLTGEETAKPPADSAGQASAGRRGPPQAPSSKAKADTAGLGPSIVEEGRTINFAQNLKDYKSPRVAMLLSLLVPGLGQAYSRNYVKAGAFGAAEAAAIGVAVYFNSVANAKKREAYKFADARFDVDQLKRYDARLRQEFDNLVRDTVMTEEEAGAYFPPYDDYFYDAAKNGTSYFYESIRDKSFTPGWKDNDSLAPSLGQILGGDTVFYAKDGSKYALFDPDNVFMFYYIKRVADGAGNIVRDSEWALGYSENQAEYNAMMKRSTVYRDAVNYTLYALLLNHIASAIDAGFTARAYNAMLLGRESAWNRVSVSQQFVFTGSEVSPGLALRLKF
ncbi:MAG: DUF5683 domain-containing protein [Chitinispirillales bacterium]|jgi:hypothetical protein|nr:DUF5683 domain-containing protein [Chitinispirillales bacterium]